MPVWSHVHVCSTGNATYISIRAEWTDASKCVHPAITATSRCKVPRGSEFPNTQIDALDENISTSAVCEQLLAFNTDSHASVQFSL